MKKVGGKMKRDRASKEDLLLIGLEMALEVGFSKITIRSFAKKAGIAVGTVYYYFKDKEDLIEAIIEKYWNLAIDEKIDAVILGSRGFIEGLERAYFFLYENYSEFHSFLTKDLGELSNSNNSSMAYHLDKLRGKLGELLDSDGPMLKQVEEISSREEFLDYMIDNIFSRLKRNKKDLGILEVFLTRVFNSKE